MRQFNFYEFTGILLPGVIVMTALTMLLPGWELSVVVKDVSVGGLGIFTVLAYAAGHLVQALGNLFETAWWKCWGGMPTDWLRTQPTRLLAVQQVSILEERLRRQLGLTDFEITSTNASEWYAITRQIYAAIAGAGRSGRVDTFSGNYGLNRGLVVGLLVSFFLLFVKASLNWLLAVCILIGTFLAFYRMDLFARHYARELFVQFLQLPEQGNNKEKNL